MVIFIDREELKETKEMLSNFCRNEKRDLVVDFSNLVGTKMIEFAIKNEFTVEELLCMVYVLSDALELAVSKVEDAFEDEVWEDC